MQHEYYMLHNILALLKSGNSQILVINGMIERLKKIIWETPRANHNIVTSRRYISLYLLYIIVNGYIQRGTS